MLLVSWLLPLSLLARQDDSTFKVDLQLVQNEGQVPPILAIPMSSGFVFEPQFPGEPKTMPEDLVNGSVIHGIIDMYQYVGQGFEAGFIDTAIYQRNMLLIDEETVIDEWVDVIFTVAVGEDEDGDPLVYYESAGGEFDMENPVYFEPTTVPFQTNVFEVMEAIVPARFEYFNGERVVTHTGEASLMYLQDTGFESLQLYFEKLRMGTWTVNGQTFDIALIKESAPPYRKEVYTYLYIDLDEDGEFDIMDDGMEAYPVTEPFNIAGESWEISEIAMDGNSFTIVPSEVEVEPKVALRPGTEAPLFTAETLDGSSLSLEDLRGKYVMIDFWGTWCGPCLDALPTIKEAYAKYGGEQFEIVGIANEPSLERFESFVDDRELDWPQIPEIYGENNAIQELYFVNVYPTYYLVNPEGEIVEYGMALSDKNLMETLARYLE